MVMYKLNFQYYYIYIATSFTSIKIKSITYWKEKLDFLLLIKADVPVVSQPG